MNTICIDARLYGIAHTGIGRYTQQLIVNLPQKVSEKVVLLISPSELNNPELSGLTKVVASYHPYSVFSQLEMLWFWWKYRPDLTHFTQSSIPVLWPGKFIVTFHDLIRHQSKGKDTTTRKHYFYWIKYYGYLLIDFIAMKRAASIIVPSNYWREILIKKYHLPENKIKVTYEGVDSKIKPINPKKDEFKIPKPFVVYTGNLYPHKNIPVLFEAIKLLNGKVNLVLVGAKSVFSARAQKIAEKFQITDSIFNLGRLTDKQISGLYSQAVAFVFPSLIEGFGLPGLEAMACGLPVIAAKASCLPEVYQDAALYFDPHNPQDLANKIYKFITNPDFGKDFSRRGIDQAKKYSWAKMGQQTWEIYQTILP